MHINNHWNLPIAFYNSNISSVVIETQHCFIKEGFILEVEKTFFPAWLILWNLSLGRSLPLSLQKRDEITGRGGGGKCNNTELIQYCRVDHWEALWCAQE